MSDPRVAVQQPTTDRVLESVADATRRDVLATLLGEPEPVSVGELATAVASLQTGRRYDDVTHADRKPIAVALVHVHLPKLASTGLLEWAPGEDVVATIDRAALDDRALRGLLAVDDEDWDAVLRALADGRRRHLLSIIEDADGTVDRRVLARRVAARELDVPPSTVPDRAVQEARTELYHTHLPMLSEAGLVAFDDDSVAYVGRSDLPTAWLSLGPAVGDERDEPTRAADGGETDNCPPADRGRRSVDGAED